MEHDEVVSSKVQPENGDRPQWKAPELTVYDIVSITETRAGGWGNDAGNWLAPLS